MDYLVHILMLICLFGVLAASLGLLVGQLGLFSAAHGAVAAVGAYSSVVVLLQFGFPFAVAWTVGHLAGALFGAVVGLLVSKLEADKVVVGTLAAQLLVIEAASNWERITKGAEGIAGIPRPVLFGFEFRTDSSLAVLALLELALCLLVMWRVTSSPFGRALRALREDDVFAAGAGVRVMSTRLIGCGLSGAFAGGCGVLFVHYLSYLGPTTFSVDTSIVLLCMVIIGGAASWWGPVLGAVLLVLIPEGLRFVGAPDSVASDIRQALYGLALIVLVIYWPKGLVGPYSVRLIDR